MTNRKQVVRNKWTKRYSSLSKVNFDLVNSIIQIAIN